MSGTLKMAMPAPGTGLVPLKPCVPLLRGSPNAAGSRTHRSRGNSMEERS